MELDNKENKENKENNVTATVKDSIGNLFTEGDMGAENDMGLAEIDTGMTEINAGLTEIDTGLNLKKRGLTATQKKACELIVMQDINGMSNDEIAEACGIHRSCFYRWKAKKEFNDYLNSLADEFQRSFLSDAFGQLRTIMAYGKNHEKLKAIELILKNQGRLKDSTEIQATVKADLDTELYLKQLGL